mmetsp:Transcript_15439/g.30952  ORF Transcript_15439/g.30952 Transcript_15439/m.30952 type:complete len:216 (-) Transcript_15439:74-721(-)
MDENGPRAFELQDVRLQLRQLALQLLFAPHLSSGVQLDQVGYLLVLGIDDVPLFLQAPDKIYSLLFRELLVYLRSRIHLPHLFLHVAIDHLVFSLDLLLHLCEILRHLAEIFLLHVVQFHVARGLGSLQDGFYGVGSDEVLCGCNAHDGSLSLGRHRGSSSILVLKLSTSTQSLLCCFLGSSQFEFLFGWAEQGSIPFLNFPCAVQSGGSKAAKC